MQAITILRQHRLGLGCLISLVAALCLTAARAEEAAKMSKELREKALAVLREGLAKGKGPVFVHAAEALIFHGYREGIAEPFTKALESADPSSTVVYRRVLARLARDPVERKKQVEAIRAIFHDSKSTGQLHAFETLAKLKYTRAPGDEVLDSAAARVKEPIAPYARWIIANGGKEEDIRALAALLRSDSPGVRLGAAYGLRHLDKVPADVVPALREAAEREPVQSASRAYLLTALWIHGTAQDREKTKPLLEGYARSGTKDDKYETAAALALKGDLSDLPVLQKLLEDPELDVRISAANAILFIGKRNP